MRLIYADEVEDIALGAAVLGTGGGGDPYIGKLMARQAIAEYGPVTMLSPEDLEDDDLIVPSAMMGAPTVMVEKLPQGDETITAFRALESYLGRKVRATMSAEAGGLNSTIPLTVAARLGIPIVDADGMGRAFPEIQMVTFTLSGISATPMALADEKGNSAIINTIDNRWTETLARSLTIDMGCTSLIALYPMNGRQLKEAGVLGTISLVSKIGGALREARRDKRDPIAAVREITGGLEIFRGKVIDVARRTETGFARGEAIMDGIDSYEGNKLKLAFQNENLVATVGERVVATVPDLITVLDAETGSPITTESLRYGFRVVVLGIPCVSKWRSAAGLALAGPRYFGYDIDFVPVEDRHSFSG